MKRSLFWLVMQSFMIVPRRCQCHELNHTPFIAVSDWWIEAYGMRVQWWYCQCLNIDCLLSRAARSPGLPVASDGSLQVEGKISNIWTLGALVEKKGTSKMTSAKCGSLNLLSHPDLPSDARARYRFRPHARERDHSLCSNRVTKFLYRFDLCHYVNAIECQYHWNVKIDDIQSLLRGPNFSLIGRKWRWWCAMYRIETQTFDPLWSMTELKTDRLVVSLREEICNYRPPLWIGRRPSWFLRWQNIIIKPSSECANRRQHNSGIASLHGSLTAYAVQWWSYKVAQSICDGTNARTRAAKFASGVDIRSRRRGLGCCRMSWINFLDNSQKQVKAQKKKRVYNR
jgi:hypothetical protein